MLPLKKNTSSDCFEIQYKIHKIKLKTVRLQMELKDWYIYNQLLRTYLLPGAKFESGT